MGRMDDSEVRGEGSRHTKWLGVFEVIQYDSGGSQCSLLQGVHQAWPLCIHFPLRFLSSPVCYAQSR